MLDSLSPKHRDDVLKEFCTEFNGKIAGLCYSNSSILNFKELLQEVYRIVKEKQDNNDSMNRINIFTLNYDNVCEYLLDELDYFYTKSTPKSITKTDLGDLVGYNLPNKRVVPSFSVIKLHGSADLTGKLNASSIILPGGEKLSKVLADDSFACLSKMRSELSKLNNTSNNTVLFVIGYSGGDEHINQMLEYLKTSGLRIYWLQWRKDKRNSVKEAPNFIDERNIIYCKNGEDTTKTLLDLLRRSCG
jgi:hypothetical protein